MTLIVRRVGSVHWSKLRKCGKCRISFVDVVGAYPSREFRVIFLEEGE